MLKKFGYGLLLLGVAFPLMVEAHQCGHLKSNKFGASSCDFTFTAVPTFTNLCVGVIEGGIYTIMNNTPESVNIKSITILNNGDALPAAASVVATAATNPCGAALASKQSCNILLNLQPLAQGTYDRTLIVGVDDSQVAIDGPPITTLVNCVNPVGPTVPPAPTPPAPPQATAAQYQVSILGGSGVSSTGFSVVNGDVDVSPGSAITGFPPATIINGSTHSNDALAIAAHAEAITYYTGATGILGDCTGSNNLTGQDLGGKTLAPGVYCFDTSAQLTGALTLAAAGPDSAFTFIIGSTLTTASNSSVVITGGGSDGNVVWAIGSSATLGTGTAFQGIIDAQISITLNTGASLVGRAWAQSGAVTLDNNLIDPS